MASNFIELRNHNKKSAILFLHGFSGSAEITWGLFPCFILQAKEHLDWDMFSLGYPTNLRPDLKGIWKADPDLQTLATELCTRLTSTDLLKYKTIALIAHSMGGLIVQRAILDLENNNKTISRKIKYVFLFSTPSRGLIKSSVLSFLKSQFKDMGYDSDFIVNLRKEWVKAKHSFNFFRAVAGDEDEFVPRISSIEVFEEKLRAIVPGDHLTMIKPVSLKNEAVQIVLNGLKSIEYPSIWNSTKIAVEKRNYHKIIKEWGPHVDDLDQKALVLYALALDEVGRRKDAINILERKINKSTDAMGVLAGRYKRQWLNEGRRDNDALKAFDLYSEAYKIAKDNNDIDQAFYNGINVAFMQLFKKNDKKSAKKTSKEVLKYCRKKKNPDKWSLATEGEAYLIIGRKRKALNKYKKAIKDKYNANIREKASMYNQAVKILEVKNDPGLIKKLDKIFNCDVY